MRRRGFLAALCAAPVAAAVARVSNVGGDQLGVLTDGSNADGLHSHTLFDPRLANVRFVTAVVMVPGVVDEWGDFFTPECARLAAEDFCARYRDGLGHSIA